jgi:hypothetical protein
VHDDSAQIEDCREFKNGRCSRGDACRFNHVGGPPPPPEGGFDERRFDDYDDESRNERQARYDDDRRFDDDDDDERIPLDEGGKPADEIVDEAGAEPAAVEAGGE